MPIIRESFREIKRMMIAEGFRPYRDSITSREKEFAQREEELRRKFDAEPQDLAEGSLDDMLDFYETSLWEVANSRRILMSSMFVGIFAWFEFQLLELSRAARRRIDCSSCEINPRSYSMKEAKKPLGKLGVKLPTDSKDWEEAKNLEAIRHLLVHYNGIVERGADPNLERYAVAKGLIVLSEVSTSPPDGSQSLKPGIQMHLTAPFCDGACTTLARLLVAVSGACDAVPAKDKNPTK